MPKGEELKKKRKKRLFFYFKHDRRTQVTIVTLGTVTIHRVIQVNRLTQVLTHRDRSAIQNSNASYRLEDLV